MTTRSQITLALISTLCAFTASATAEPYWVAWEGNDFPENEGWERIVNGPQPAERTLADGIMTMDGLADTQIDDYYRMDRLLDPEPGEEFVMQWRLRIDEVIGSPLALNDPGIGVSSDEDWQLLLVFGVDFIRSFHEDVILSFEPQVFHAFEVRSSDMQSYELRMDGTTVHVGSFWEPSFQQSRIEWGDATRGAASLVDWDYFRFGVVPEPAAIWLVLVGLGAAVALRGRRVSGRLVVLSVLLGAVSAPATATPYWVAWEGNDFPENEGWERIVNGPQPAVRTLADGIMTMDGLADRQIDDYYRMQRLLDPEPDEQFVMQWRLRVQEVVGNPLTLYDPGVAVFSDDDWTVSLLFGTDFIRSFHEHVIIPMQPDVFHEFEFRSSDMRSYELYVDETLVHNGSFWEPTFESSKVAWGDVARGSASLSDWDYFRVGVVPEPEAIWLVLVGLGAAVALRGRRVSGRLVVLSVLLGAVSAPATATPYWVAWEGNDFPENEGWERIVNGPQPAERTLADGIMTMDGLADRQIDDYYRMDRALDPESAEMFMMQTRVRVNEVIGHPLSLYDAGFAVWSDDDWALLFVLGVDFLRSFHEDVNLPFEAHVFHTFEVRSWDMEEYQLRIDGVSVFVGSFWEPSFQQSRIAWGDLSRGSATHADWDFFRFGVVPEPQTLLLFSFACALHAIRK